MKNNGNNDWLHMKQIYVSEVLRNTSKHDDLITFLVSKYSFNKNSSHEFIKKLHTVLLQISINKHLYLNFSENVIIMINSLWKPRWLWGNVRENVLWNIAYHELLSLMLSNLLRWYITLILMAYSTCSIM